MNKWTVFRESRFVLYLFGYMGLGVSSFGETVLVGVVIVFFF